MAPYLQLTMLHNRGQKSQIKSKKITTWEGKLHLSNGLTEKEEKYAFTILIIIENITILIKIENITILINTENV